MARKTSIGINSEEIAESLEALATYHHASIEAGTIVQKRTWRVASDPDCSQFVLATPDGKVWDVVVRERD